jgi:aspartate kinase
MEEILRWYFEKKNNLNELLIQLKKTHFQIASDLDENGLILNHILEDIFEQLEERLQEDLSDNFDYEYDKIVSFGEILSTNLISAYLI